MAPRKGGRFSRTKKVVLGGVFAALALMVLLMGGFLPVATFSAPILASLFLLPLVMELGAKTALVAYVAVSLLALLLVPDKELVLFFVLLAGYYPILQPRINRMKHRFLRYGAKFLLFNAAILLLYALLLVLFASPELLEEFTGYSGWFLAALLVMGNVTFFLYDMLIDKMRIVYICKVQKHLFR